MPLMTLQIAIALTSLLIGLIVGCWLQKNQRLGTSSQLDERAHLVSEALHRLRELSSTIRSDVGQHNSQVREINTELRSTADDDEHVRDGAMVAVAKLIASNQRMQQRLATTEEKLRRQAEEIDEHIEMSRTDALTGLANRRAFDDEIDRRLAEWRRHETPVSLMILDIDRFKQFNDNHGHVVGDEVLRSISKALIEATREIDIVARFGGEEMAVVMPNTSWQEAALAAERARLDIAKARIMSRGEELSVTVSVGLAEILPNDNAITLVDRADQAMYASKRAGRNLTHLHDGETEVLVTQAAETTAVPEDRAESDEGTIESRWPSASAKANGAVDKAEATPATVSAPARKNAPNDQSEAAPELLLTRSAFCDEVRRHLADTSLDGNLVTVLLIEIDRYDELKTEFGQTTVQAIHKSVFRFIETATSGLDQIGSFEDHRFAVLVPRMETNEVAGIAERLRVAVASSVVRNLDSHCQFTIAAGLATAQQGDNLETLILRSENALSKSLDAGGNRTSVHDGSQSSVLASV